MAPMSEPTSDPNEPVRLSKLMAQRGLCSRREADAWIERGLVLVDGVPVTQLGTKIRPDQTITLANAARQQQQQLATILLNKPVGYVSGQPEKDYVPAVTLINAESQILGQDGRRFDFRDLRGLAPAGRLDIDSRGLLIFTQDGRIAKRLTSAEGEIEKEYLVSIEGEPGIDEMRRLRHGIVLDDRPLRPCQVETAGVGRLRFTLREGRHRQIRRMCEDVGLKVRSLLRTRIGRIRMYDLPEGGWRFLQPDEQF